MSNQTIIDGNLRVWIFDPDTRENVGCIDCQPSPEEESEWIKPESNFTTDDPGQAPSGKYNYRNSENTAWELHDDTRGIWYKSDRSPIKVNSLSDAIAPDWTREPLPLSSAEQKAAQLVKLKADIAEIEQKAIMPRGAREAFIALCRQQATAAGLTEPQLYAANPFYKGLKDTDAIATELRAQIRALS